MLILRRGNLLIYGQLGAVVRGRGAGGGEALWGKRWCEAQGGSRVDLKGKERRLGCEGKWQVEKKEKERGKERKIGV